MKSPYYFPTAGYSYILTETEIFSKKLLSNNDDAYMYIPKGMGCYIRGVSCFRKIYTYINGHTSTDII